MEVIINTQITLERIPGKGGWTYARIPGIQKEDGAAFGMVRVKGSIDGYEIDTCSIMPMGNGGHFLPVKAEIRKAIKKEEGDSVHIILYKDDEPYKVPAELQLRLEEEGVYKNFLKHKQWEQRMCAKWIFSAKRTETVNERIIKTILRLKRNEKII
ncbi:DUF1905 domain-containing protein [Flavobacterium sp. RHBU_3]|uniref:DUF1905 domain-containing protein n=1 Tax=Flavobacterium sp. RHBU_3 TaxID=3391184 RepID=UPI003985609E